MKLFVVFAVIVTRPTVYGWVDWLSLHVGNSQLPTTESEAGKDGWQVTLNDTRLKMVWYMKNSDPSLMVAFDGRKNVAGLRINSLKTGVDDAYVGVYKNSGAFEETRIGRKKYFSSSVLFSPPSVLRSGGRKRLASDEVALGVYVKKGSAYEHLHREGCQHADTGVVEQGCQPQYGLVFSEFTSDSSCEHLYPLYTVWDSQGTGNLIGFGWLTFGKVIPPGDTVTEESLKALFPQRPSCLDAAAHEGRLSAVEVWLAKDASSQSACDNYADSWTAVHCDKNMRSMHTIL